AVVARCAFTSALGGRPSAPGPRRSAPGAPNKKPPVASGAAGGGRSASAGTLEEALELPAPDGVLQLADGLGLDLPDPLAGDLEDPADLLERVGVAVAQAVPQLDDLALAVGQGLEHLVGLLLEHLLGGGVDRALGGLVLDEVAEVAVLALADRAVEADR